MIELNCKVLKSSNSNPPFLHQTPFQGYPPFLAKHFAPPPPPSDTIFGRSYPPAPLIRDGVQTMKAFLVFTLTETSFVTSSYSWIFLVRSANSPNLVYKLLHFENVKIHEHFLYWKVFSTDIYRKIYLSSLLLFWPYLLISKLYELSL